MKKTRFSLLIVALLLMAMALSACGKVKTASIDEYLNADYDLSEEMYVKANALYALEGYSVDEYLSNDNFVVFVFQDVKDGNVITSYKLLSMYSGEIIQEFIDTEDVNFVFETKSSAVVVKKSVLNAKNIDMEPDLNDVDKVMLAQAVHAYRQGILDDAAARLLEDYITETYTLYDGTGAAVATTEYDAEFSDFADLMVYDDVAYRVNEKTGEWTKEIEIPEYMPLENVFMRTDEYYYAGSEYALTVYDKELNLVASFPLPNYGDESMVHTYEMFDDVSPFSILNNGDVLIQFAMVQDEDADKYDFGYVIDENTVKANLVTLRFSIEEKAVETLDLDYVIVSLISNDLAYDDNVSAEENVVLDGAYENIALLAPIQDQRVLFAADKQQCAIVDNDLDIVKSLKIVENQANEVPEKIADDLYAVELVSGAIALVNGEGEIQTTISSYLDQVGAYWVGEDAIYDLSLNKVKDLKNPDVSYRVMNDSIFVTTKTSSEEYTVELLRDGKVSEVYKHREDDKTRFALGEGYYYIVNEADDYKYYTIDGKELITTKRALYIVMSSDDSGVAVLRGLPMDSETDKVVYYVFSK